MRAIVAWLGVAMVAGPAMGAAGGAWAAFGDRRLILAVALLAGGLLAEAAQGFIPVQGWTGIDLGRSALQVALVDALAAAIAPVLLLRPRNLPAASAAALAVAAIGLAVLGVVESAVAVFMRG